MADIDYHDIDIYWITDEFLEPNIVELPSFNVEKSLKCREVSDTWITSSVQDEGLLEVDHYKPVRMNWRQKYTHYLGEISKSPQKENLEYVVFIEIIENLTKDFDLRQPILAGKATSVHKKSFINFLRHAPDLYKHLSADSLFIDSDTHCVSIQIKRNHITMNMFFKKDGGILFNTFDDDEQDDSFRIFGDLLTSSKSYLKAAKIKRILSILGK